MHCRVFAGIYTLHSAWCPVCCMPQSRSLTISGHEDPGGQVVSLRIPPGGRGAAPPGYDVVGRQYLCASHGRPWHAGVPVGRELRCLSCVLANVLALKSANVLRRQQPAWLQPGDQAPRIPRYQSVPVRLWHSGVPVAAFGGLGVSRQMSWRGGVQMSGYDSDSPGSSRSSGGRDAAIRFPDALARGTAVARTRLLCQVRRGRFARCRTSTPSRLFYQAARCRFSGAAVQTAVKVRCG